MLINNTKKVEDLQKLGIEQSSFVRVMDEVFGQKPNIANLVQFFRNEVVQDLWWSTTTSKPGFIKSDKLAKIIDELSVEEMKKLNQLLEQVCPPGQDIIPT